MNQEDPFYRHDRPTGREPLSINHLAVRAQEFHEDGIPVGTFREDNDDPARCRVVYLTFAMNGSMRLQLKPVDINGRTYRLETQSKRKGYKGSVSIAQVRLFQDIPNIPDALGDSTARWAFEQLRRKGITQGWGIESYDQLKLSGKKKKDQATVATVASTEATVHSSAATGTVQAVDSIPTTGISTTVDAAATIDAVQAVDPAATTARAATSDPAAALATDTLTDTDRLAPPLRHSGNDDDMTLPTFADGTHSNPPADFVRRSCLNVINMAPVFAGIMAEIDRSGKQVAAQLAFHQLSTLRRLISDELHHQLSASSELVTIGQERSRLADDPDAETRIHPALLRDLYYD
ncbi:hypothetical protein CNMCM5793_000389 [Aspergillus hiratsukae]|uniref:Uncharacterized protein n=1 Tax=Aspergillus hiratsukae TaxID=1194566 RepID=A0A8H6Q7W8_9EURO|nr:hypothetical protein CNMCM5793_000389 [Aspergillus hiratsukae]KAF7168101.1 hypothetical protein CNMCM6106_003427 [Aspergillus hiratsukae]